MHVTRVGTLADLEQAGHLVEQRVGPDGTFHGWDGRDVLCHLAVYARLVRAVMRSTAEKRLPTSVELYGRELTQEEQALTDLDAINEAQRSEYAALSYDEGLAFWRAMHAEAVARSRGDFNSTQLRPWPNLGLESSSSLGLCSIIVSEIEENVMLRRWAKAQFGGEVGWRA